MSKKYKRFCINCGATGLKREELIDGLCFNCFKDKNPLIKIKSQPLINVCKECLAIKTRNEWLKTTPPAFYERANALLNRDVGAYFKFVPDTEVEMKLEEFDRIEDLLKYNTIPLILYMKRKIEGQLELQDTQRHSVRIKLDTCETCKDFKSSASKSKIRIIAKKRKITDEEIEEIIKIFQSSAEIFKDPNLYILPPVISQTELIFRVNSVDFAKMVARQLKKRFGAVLRESIKFMDREKSKTKKHDLNILVRLMPFLKGDIIKYDNELLFVISIEHDFVDCLDFKSGEAKKFKSKQIINGKKYLDKSKFDKFVVTAIYKDEIQVMDLKTFQTFEIEIKDKPVLNELREGLEISGFREGEKVYLIPVSLQGID